MEIGTGYFAKARNYADAGYALVSIALKDPWFLPSTLKMHKLPELAPTEEILGLRLNPEVYKEEYFKQILKSPLEIYSKIYAIAQEEKKDKVALLCYESPEKFCHRHLVARWLSNHIGCTVKEIELNSQESLFDSDSF